MNFTEWLDAQGGASKRRQEAPAKRLSLLSLAVLMTHLGAGTAHANDFASAFADALTHDSEVALHLRSYYLDRHWPDQRVSAAWATGGWIGYRTGWLGDRLRLGGVGYTSQPTWAPDDTEGTLLLGPRQSGLSVVGQAYLSLKLADALLTAGRFEVDQAEVNPNDIRMIPNTFQGVAVQGASGGVNWYAAYLNAMKPIDAAHFIGMATIAGAPQLSSPLWLLSLHGPSEAESSWRLASYYVPDVLSSTYADGYATMALSQVRKLRLGVQGMYQTSVGSHAPLGRAWSTGVGGARVEWIAGETTASLAYNQTGRGASYRDYYGAWQGYSSMIVLNFDRAGEKVLVVGGSQDFTRLGLPGMLLNVQIASGHGARLAETGAPLPQTTEYDMTLDYRFVAERWPTAARALWLRLRAAYVDQGAVGRITDYRVIVNYPYNW